jgi:hypothetical protein
MRFVLCATTALMLGFCASAAGAAAVTDDLVHLFTADNDDDGDTTWEDEVGVRSFDLSAGSPNVTRSAVTGSATLLTHTYVWAEGAQARLDLKSGEIPVAPDATFELWFRVGGLLTGDVDQTRPLLDWGGGGEGAGIYLTYDATAGETRIEGRPSTSDVLTSAALAAGDVDDFVQVVLAVDGTNDQARLYVNLAETAGALSDENFGNNPIGIGSQEGQAGGIPDTSFTCDPFVGEISLLRVYHGSAFTVDEVTQNYNAVIPEPATAAVLATAALAALTRRRRRSGIRARR